MPPVHPHASGEHKIAYSMFCWSIGSSPREWGTLLQVTHGICARRFIPTRVGNTHFIVAGAGCLSVHPHASGEHCRALPIFLPRSGSSPREWGTRQSRSPAQAVLRFIPTRVGNTRRGRAVRRRRPVHPHASGEHLGDHTSTRGRFGSSPREWGTHTNWRCNAAASTVHPHASGEHRPFSFTVLIIDGSSPREWGTPALLAFYRPRLRFIPTRVGNT